MFVGIDDTDSVRGMCTTYLAARLCRKLNVKEIPRLVRLNPNIPYRTRGNGAVAFNAKGKDVIKSVLSEVEAYSMMEDDGTNPGVAFLDANQVPDSVCDFYTRAVSELVTVEEAQSVADEEGVSLHKFKSGRGVIGALAAIGFMGEKTYELIAYRRPENFGTPRRVNKESVMEMDARLHPRVFDSVDDKGRQILVSPRGYDPVLCGIRGKSADDVKEAWDMVEVEEQPDMMQVFATNQATDAHLVEKPLSEVRQYDCIVACGNVNKAPSVIEGGHVIFGFSDESGSIDCAAYSQTMTLRKAAEKLLPGDRVTVYGGFGKYPRTLNLEKLRIEELVQATSDMKPSCCGRSMTSAGRDKGLKCRVCGKKSVAVSESTVRGIKAGLYDAVPQARRHLSKPAFL